MRLVASRAEVAQRFAVRWGTACSRNEQMYGLFDYYRHGALGEIVLNTTDLNIDVVAHECFHAALHAERRGGRGNVIEDEKAEERVAWLTGMLTRAVVKLLARRGHPCASA